MKLALTGLIALLLVGCAMTLEQASREQAIVVAMREVKRRNFTLPRGYTAKVAPCTNDLWAVYFTVPAREKGLEDVLCLVFVHRYTYEVKEVSGFEHPRSGAVR